MLHDSSRSVQSAPRAGRPEPVKIPHDRTWMKAVQEIYKCWRNCRTRKDIIPFFYASGHQKIRSRTVPSQRSLLASQINVHRSSFIFHSSHFVSDILKEKKKNMVITGSEMFWNRRTCQCSTGIMARWNSPANSCAAVSSAVTVRVLHGCHSALVCFGHVQKLV